MDVMKHNLLRDEEEQFVVSEQNFKSHEIFSTDPLFSKVSESYELPKVT